MVIFSKRTTTSTVAAEARRRAQECAAKQEAITSDVAQMRGQRQALLRAVGTGEEGAGAALEKLDQKMFDALRQARLLRESRAEIEYTRRRADVAALRSFAESKLEELQKHESAIASAIAGVLKATAALELGEIEEITSGADFCHPGVATFQEPRMRVALAESITASVSLALLNPTAGPNVDFSKLRALFQELLKICAVADKQADEQIERDRQNCQLDRQEMERQVV